MNKENFKLVLDKIKSAPECWNQQAWHCNTTHCLGGWAQILSGNAPNNKTVRTDARIFLDLTATEADYLFTGERTIEDFEAAAACEGFNRDGYDRDGFNRDGFNRYGFDRSGRDRDGFNLDGYDREGFNLYGFNLDGFNRYGFNRSGRDRDGFNLDGYDRKGFDRDGLDRDGLDRFNKPRTELL